MPLRPRVPEVVLRAHPDDRDDLVQAGGDAPLVPRAAGDGDVVALRGRGGAHRDDQVYMMANWGMPYYSFNLQKVEVVVE
jgi:hypothetical protein